MRVKPQLGHGQSGYVLFKLLCGKTCSLLRSGYFPYPACHSGAVCQFSNRAAHGGLVGDLNRALGVQDH